jgi:hypothetical protein
VTDVRQIKDAQTIHFTIFKFSLVKIKNPKKDKVEIKKKCVAGKLLCAGILYVSKLKKVYLSAQRQMIKTVADKEC